MGAPTVTTAIEQPASAQQVAELVRERMFAGDRASRAFGMQVTHMAPGTATLNSLRALQAKANAESASVVIRPP